MDKALAKKLGQETVQALQAVAEKNGLTVTSKGGRFDPVTGSLVIKVEYAASDTEQREFEKLAPYYGLDADDYGMEVGPPLVSRKMKLVAINTRAPKYPFIGEAAGGKRFKLTEAAVAAVKQLRRKEV